MDVLNARVNNYDVPGYTTEFSRTSKIDRTHRVRRADDPVPGRKVVDRTSYDDARLNDSDDEEMRIIRNRGEKFVEIECCSIEWNKMSIGNGVLRKKMTKTSWPIVLKFS